MFGPLLLLLGCVLSAAAVVMLRRNAADWRRFRGAARVTGEVIDDARGTSGVTRVPVRVRFHLRGQSHVTVLTAWWDAEDHEWRLGGDVLGDRVRLLVPPDRPGDATPAGDVKAFIVVPGGIGLIGSAAIGFGLLFLTESLAVAGPLFVGAWVCGLGLFAYYFFSRADAEPGAAPDPGPKAGRGR